MPMKKPSSPMLSTPRGTHHKAIWVYSISIAVITAECFPSSAIQPYQVEVDSAIGPGDQG